MGWGARCEDLVWLCANWRHRDFNWGCRWRIGSNTNNRSRRWYGSGHEGSWRWGWEQGPELRIVHVGPIMLASPSAR
jgi:hypothetical protein